MSKHLSTNTTNLRKQAWLSILAFLSVLFVYQLSYGQNIPKRPNPPRLVNDFVGAFSQTEIQSLEQKLVAFDDSTSNQVAVVVIESLDGYDMNTYAVKLGRDWGIGQNERNNGIVFLWSTGDRKVYIATGYGLEGALPDAYAKRIISQVVIPNFKNGQFFKGVDEGVDAIINYTKGEYLNDQADGEPGASGFLIILAVIAAVIILSIIFGKRGGNGGGGMMRRSSSAWPYTTYTGWGNQSGNWGGGGGWSGGGGGFGGFGGGSFGGGGAGGSY
ncbi:TPM domain-containing protein [Marinilongibacter aquaticus]|uniref:TPM domain-containing protein n=1 Tax=Marinilongibacter aquaticus TaxID=2975157 RepID=UPI0021BDE608|nr:TPM domain-containing protein [Marinilongibacter aquaticus]UBM60449.1 TPM domain-containing protein [Marinilongibacter aquaticus]